MPHLVEQLNLLRYKKTVFVMFEREMTDDGLAVDLPEFGGIYVYINPRLNMLQAGFTLAHEMVHVSQMMRGTLKILEDGAHLWNGKLYSRDEPYMSRPWELRSFALQEILVRRALEKF